MAALRDETSAKIFGVMRPTATLNAKVPAMYGVTFQTPTHPDIAYKDVVFDKITHNSVVVREKEGTQTYTLHLGTDSWQAMSNGPANDDDNDEIDDDGSSPLGSTPLNKSTISSPGLSSSAEASDSNAAKI